MYPQRKKTASPENPQHLRRRDGVGGRINDISVGCIGADNLSEIIIEPRVTPIIGKMKAEKQCPVGIITYQFYTRYEIGLCQRINMKLLVDF